MRCAFIRSDGRPNRCTVLQRFFCHEKVGIPPLSQRITPAQRGIHAWCPVRCRIRCALAPCLPSGCPPLPSPPQGGSPAHHPRRRAVRAALRRLPRRFAPTSPASGYPHRPPSTLVERMMRGSGVRALAGWAPVRSLRWLPLRFAQTSPASVAPPAHPASV